MKINNYSNTKIIIHKRYGSLNDYLISNKIKNEKLVII